MVTLIHLRHDLPHTILVLVLLFRVDRSTVTWVVGEIRALLAEWGCAVPRPARPASAHLGGHIRLRPGKSVELRLDATEVQMCRPRAGRGGRRAFVSGNKKQNTMEATVFADHRRRTLWINSLWLGRLHDATAVRTEDIDVCFRNFPKVKVLLGDGYVGLRRDHHAHSSHRITVEHALANYKRWKQLARWTRQRENLSATYRAIAEVVYDRTTNILKARQAGP